ncbi:MFS transporter [Xanthomonas campestris pv. phormiicola]|nr:MFS transporter [Xanthomonas campestris pv. phormiicola]
MPADLPIATAERIASAVPDAAARPAIRATRWVFLLSGIAMAAWAPMVPYVKARFALDDAALGLVLLAFGGGSILAMPLAGVLSHRVGSRAVMVASGLALCLGLPLVALAPTVPGMVAALLYFGAALGALDVAMNAHGVETETRAGRPVMSSFHGVFSVGGLTGAAAMSALLALGTPLLAATLAVSALLLALLLWQRAGLLAGAGGDPAQRTALRLPRGVVLVLGALCFICLLAEGAMLDWSAVLLREFHGMDTRYAGVGYALFSVAMAAGRFGGDRVVARIGQPAMLAAGASLAAGGLLLATLLQGVASGLLGYALVGLGVSNLVPILFGAAGRLPGTSPAVAIAALTTLGYTGLLAGPALIGFLAHASSLPTALLAVAGLLLLVVMGSRLLRH